MLAAAACVARRGAHGAFAAASARQMKCVPRRRAAGNIVAALSSCAHLTGGRSTPSARRGAGLCDVSTTCSRNAEIIAQASSCGHVTFWHLFEARRVNFGDARWRAGARKGVIRGSYVAVESGSISCRQQSLLSIRKKCPTRNGAMK